MAWWSRRTWWSVGGAGAAILLVFGATRDRGSHGSASQAATHSESATHSDAKGVETVETLSPTAGGIARRTVQPGSAHSFESARLFAKVSGYLKAQRVDIGSVVKRGDLLAEIEVPELVQEVARDAALLRQAEAEVVQAKANVVSSIAERKAAESGIALAEANVKRSQSEREFRDKQHQRIRELHRLNSIEERLVDERLDQLHAAESAELAAESAVHTAREQAAAAAARVGQAEADLLVARAKVEVAQATLSKTQAMFDYSRILSPYDGIVTERNFHLGEFVRAADKGDSLPLLCVDRVDRIRVIVRVPDRDVPYVQPGDVATVHFDALPKTNLQGKVARVAGTEDHQTRMMRVEIDVPNEKGLIRDGMYGQVEIELEPPSQGVTVPSSCLVGDASSSSAKVFVVHDGKLRLQDVKIGKDTGSEVEIEAGVSASDQVVTRPTTTLADGMTVRAVAAAPPKVASH